ncbi:MAG TPA: PAS domain S-box protein [Solirubrobacteraceae bacterium]|jgi:PAS domain S-box-containing protein
MAAAPTTEPDPAPLDARLSPGMQAVLDAALDCVVAMDADGRVVALNPAAERTFGYPAAAAVGRDMAELIVPPALRERHREGLRRHLAGGPRVVLDRRIEITGLRADGTEFPVELTVTRVKGDGEPLFVGYLRDISDRIAAEAELRHSRLRILETAYAARRRIERDLHDGAQQRLVMLTYQLRAARQKAGGEAAELLDEALGELDTAIGELRELARGMYPAVLSEAGLAPALRSLANRAPLPVAVGAPAGRRYAPSLEATAYFVAAEALTNAVRHAQATEAAIEVTDAPGCLRVTVRDDGAGGASLEGGSGLRGLRDRVVALGGTLSVTSPPGEGTTICAELPCAS